MKKITYAVAVLAVLLAAGLMAYGAGTVTATPNTWRTVNEVEFVYAVSSNMTGVQVANFSGEILRVVASAQAAATNGLSIYLKDEDGVDVFGGGLAPMSNVAVNLYADHADTLMPIAVNGPLYMSITNANIDVTGGVVRVYYR